MPPTGEGQSVPQLAEATSNADAAIDTSNEGAQIFEFPKGQSVRRESELDTAIDPSNTGAQIFQFPKNQDAIDAAIDPKIEGAEVLQFPDRQVTNDAESQISTGDATEISPGEFAALQNTPDALAGAEIPVGETAVASFDEFNALANPGATEESTPPQNKDETPGLAYNPEKYDKLVDEMTLAPMDGAPTPEGVATPEAAPAPTKEEVLKGMETLFANPDNLPEELQPEKGETPETHRSKLMAEAQAANEARSRLNKEQQEQVAWSLNNFGYKAEQIKNDALGGAFDYVSQKFGNEGLASSKGARGTVGRFLAALGNSYKERNGDLDKRMKLIEDASKNGGLTTEQIVGHTMQWVGGAMRWGRILKEAGSWTVAAPLRIGQIVATALETGTRAGKEARLMNEEVINQTRISAENLNSEENEQLAFASYKENHPDFVMPSEPKERMAVYEKARQEYALNQAWDEASKIQDAAEAKFRAKNPGASEEALPTAEDYKRAYSEGLPKDLLKRLESNPMPGGANSLMQRAFRKHLEIEAGQMEKKLSAIENDSRLSDEQKETAKERYLDNWGNGKTLKDFDRMLTRQGKVDTLAMTMRYGTGLVKIASVALMGESMKHVWDHIADAMAGGASLESANALEHMEHYGLDAEETPKFTGALEHMEHYGLGYEGAPAVLGGNEYAVKHGDTMTSILRSRFPGITDTQIENLRTQDLKALGIPSGNLDKIAEGAKIDISKFAAVLKMDPNLAPGTIAPPPIEGAVPSAVEESVKRGMTKGIALGEAVESARRDTVTKFPNTAIEDSGAEGTAPSKGFDLGLFDKTPRREDTPDVLGVFTPGSLEHGTPPTLPSGSSELRFDEKDKIWKATKFATVPFTSTTELAFNENKGLWEEVKNVTPQVGEVTPPVAPEAPSTPYKPLFDFKSEPNAPGGNGGNKNIRESLDKVVKPASGIGKEMANQFATEALRSFAKNQKSPEAYKNTLLVARLFGFKNV